MEIKGSDILYHEYKYYSIYVRLKLNLFTDNRFDNYLKKKNNKWTFSYVYNCVVFVDVRNIEQKRSNVCITGT